MIDIHVCGKMWFMHIAPETRQGFASQRDQKTSSAFTACRKTINQSAIQLEALIYHTIIQYTIYAHLCTVNHVIWVYPTYLYKSFGGGRLLWLHPQSHQATSRPTIHPLVDNDATLRRCESFLRERGWKDDWRS